MRGRAPLLGTAKDVLRLWNGRLFSEGPAFGEYSFLRAFEIKIHIKRYVKVLCKWVSL
jgi:hypothetical protein